ncbi:MAG: hypothetical protein RL616_252 [Verrucomicrobiota bacterium]|jgi:lysylphosphatidylglycerol synthetase-like protein (DUF2156 family)
MKPTGESNRDQAPIGMSAVVCVAGFLLAQSLSKIVHLDEDWDWILIPVISIFATFVVLHRSAWRRELSKFTRTLSLLLTACIIFAVVLAGGFLVLATASIFVSGNLVAG